MHPRHVAEQCYTASVAYSLQQHMERGQRLVSIRDKQLEYIWPPSVSSHTHRWARGYDVHLIWEYGCQQQPSLLSNRKEDCLHVKHRFVIFKPRLRCSIAFTWLEILPWKTDGGEGDCGTSLPFSHQSLVKTSSVPSVYYSFNIIPCNTSDQITKQTKTRKTPNLNKLPAPEFKIIRTIDYIPVIWRI